MPTTGDRTRRERAGERARPWGSKEARQRSAIALSAAAAPFAGAAPIGVTLLDVAWSAGIAALVAYLASSAKRGPLVIASILTIAVSRSAPAALCAILAVACASLATRHLNRRAFLARGLAGGAMVVSVLATGATQAWWLTAIGSAGIALVVVSGYRASNRHVRRRLRWSAVGAVAFVLIASILALGGAIGSLKKIDAGTAQLELGLASARQGDAAGAATHLQLANLQLGRAQVTVQRLGLLGQLVPVTAQHVNALTAVLDQVRGAATQAIATANATNMSDLTVVAGRIDVDKVAALEQPFRRLSHTLAGLVDEVDDRLDGPLVPAFKDRLRTLGEQAGRAEREAHLGAEGAREMPEFLGGGSPKHYLVLFTSPAEARGRFGFPASYAEVTMDRGRFLLGEHGASSTFLRGLAVDPATFDVTDQLRPYLPYGALQQFLSATLPPDFPTVARLTADLWRSSGRAPVDGVLRFDPAALAALVAFTGPVSVGSVPEPLTAVNLERFLVFDQYVQFPSEVAPRREVLQTVSDVTFERLQGANLPSPRTLIDVFAPLVHAEHLEVGSFDRGTARLLDQVDIDGRFAPPTNDGLMVSNINSTANKIDSFLTKSVTYDATERDGRLTGTLSVALKNSAPAAGLPLYVIGSATKPPLPKGTNRTTLLVYTGAPGDEVRVDGQVVPAPPATRTGGWWLHVVTVDLPPGATKTVSIALDGPLRDPDGPYALQLLPGGGTTSDEYQATVTTERGRVTFKGRIPTATVLR